MIQEPHRSPDERPTGKTAHKFLKYFSLFMTLVYPAFGLYLLLSSPDQIALDQSTKIILGTMLILYGIFRFIRTYKRYFRQDSSNRYL
jgi:hypothetical protein